MQAGTGSWVLSPIQVKMDVTFDDPALVVPCWWGQLTNLMAFYLLELLVGNEDRDTQYHQKCPSFFKIKSNYVIMDSWAEMIA